jgi:hypothetical protein
MTHRAAAAFLSSFLVLPACLPDETRTPPGALVVEMVGNEATNTEVESADGWALKLSRVYASVGHIELTGDGCEAYSEADYSRILDLGRAEPQRVSLSYGLGTCSLSFTIAEPRWNTIVGEGVTAEMAQRFRTPGSDGETEGGASLYLEGEGRRGDTVVRFAWTLRPYLVFSDCRRPAETSAPVVLTSKADQALGLELDPLALFRDDSGELHFQPFAAADSAAQADGEVTLAELRAVSGGTASETLLHDVYYSRLPRIAGLSGAACLGQIKMCGSDCDD